MRGKLANKPEKQPYGMDTQGPRPLQRCTFARGDLETPPSRDSLPPTSSSGRFAQRVALISHFPPHRLSNHFRPRRKKRTNKGRRLLGAAGACQTSPAAHARFAIAAQPSEEQATPQHATRSSVAWAGREPRRETEFLGAQARHFRGFQTSAIRRPKAASGMVESCQRNGKRNRR